jgi:hypothetical protein
MSPPILFSVDVATASHGPALWTTHPPSPTANVWASLTVTSHMMTGPDLDREALVGSGRAVELPDLRASIGAPASTQPWSGQLAGRPDELSVIPLTVLLIRTTVSELRA